MNFTTFSKCQCGTKKWFGRKRRSHERGRGANSEESWLNTKLHEGSEARPRQRQWDPSYPLYSAPITSVGKTPGVTFGWLSQLYFLNKQFCTLWSCTACLIRSLLPKQPREMEVSSSHTDNIGLLSHEAKRARQWHVPIILELRKWSQVAPWGLLASQPLYWARLVLGQE